MNNPPRVPTKEEFMRAVDSYWEDIGESYEFNRALARTLVEDYVNDLYRAIGESPAIEQRQDGSDQQEK